MRSRGALALAALLLPLGLLSACSGGDDEPAPDAESSTKPGDAEVSGPKEKIRNCKVTAEITGAQTASGISGKGRAVVGTGSGPDAFYQFEAEGLVIAAYSEGADFSPSLSVTVGDAAYSTLTNSEGLDIATDGKQATIDAEAQGVDPDAEGIRVVAEFTCR